MSIIHSPYDALATRGMSNLQKIRDQIEECILRGGVTLMGEISSQEGKSGRIYRVTGGSVHSDSIPYFNHPMILADDQGKAMVAFDARQFGRMSQQQGAFMVRNIPEHDWAMQRAVLSLRWSMGERERLKSYGQLPMHAYASMVSQSLTRRFILDPAESLTLSVLAGFFYACGHGDEAVAEVEKVQFVTKMARALRCPTDFVITAVEGVEHLGSLEELCRAVRDKTGDRMAGLEPAVIVAMCASNWYGTNAREIMAVALEHIPTWMMVTYACLNEATYKRTPVAKVVALVAKNHSPEAYGRAMASLVDFEAKPGEQALPF